jgi:hypothetical protein
VAPAAGNPALTARYVAKPADRVTGLNGHFKISAVLADGATLNNADASNVEWMVIL